MDYIVILLAIAALLMTAGIPLYHVFHETSDSTSDDSDEACDMTDSTSVCLYSVPCLEAVLSMFLFYSDEDEEVLILPYTILEDKSRIV